MPTVSPTAYANAKLAKFKQLVATANAARVELEKARLQLQIHAPDALGVDLNGLDDEIIIPQAEKAVRRAAKELWPGPGNFKPTSPEPLWSSHTQRVADSLHSRPVCDDWKGFCPYCGRFGRGRCPSCLYPLPAPEPSQPGPDGYHPHPNQGCKPEVYTDPKTGKKWHRLIISKHAVAIPRIIAHGIQHNIWLDPKYNAVWTLQGSNAIVDEIVDGYEVCEPLLQPNVPMIRANDHDAIRQHCRWN